MPDDALTAEPTAIAKRDDVTEIDILQMLANAAANPKVDPAKMEQLMNLSERIAKQKREVAYADAMARVQAKLPQIDKHGFIEIRPGVRQPYAKLEDIDVQIRPILAAEGFSVSFNEEEVGDKWRRYSCKISHQQGHFEIKQQTLPFDTSGSKNATQSAGSTFAYARRYLLKMAFNIVEKEEDQDGVDLEAITDDQARDLETMIQDVKADRARFLKFMQVDDVAKILKRDYLKATSALDAKRKQHADIS